MYPYLVAAPWDKYSARFLERTAAEIYAAHISSTFETYTCVFEDGRSEPITKYRNGKEVY